MNHEGEFGLTLDGRSLDFRLTDDHRLLAATVERLVREQYGFDVHRAAIASETGWNRAFWAQLAELGILGAALPEEAGGLGGTALETMLVMRAFGAGLVLGPYLSTSRARKPLQAAGCIPAM